MTKHPTGEQFLISSGRYTAVVTEVGATLRSLTVDGAQVLWTFGEDEAPRGSMGRQLLPWPNRIRDGRYTFEGVSRQLPITEVERLTALHGLGESRPWNLSECTDDSVTLTTTYYPQPGWDGILEARITHRLDDEGLTVIMEAANLGRVAFPFGYGAHPYIAADLSTARLTIPFRRELRVDAERLLPLSLGPVSAEHDFTLGRVVGDTTFDTAFVDPVDVWEITVESRGRRVTMWADDSLPWAQVFTPPSRDALAIEPMTCGPDAFNLGPTHDSLRVLQPGEATHSMWGIRIS